MTEPIRNTLPGLYDAMLEAYGPRHWWPGETPFEVIVGAILTQNTAWRNVERAIANLIEADTLNPARLRDIPKIIETPKAKEEDWDRINLAELGQLVSAI